MNAYDEVRYPSYTHPQTHPDRLATAGVLHGLRPAQVERCRVLELGCGDGSNLIPMACGLPGSEFVGIDLAAQRVQEGNTAVAELGLRNIRLVSGDLADPAADWGRFDYIIAHGVYSWVPAPVRDRLLAVCAASLNPDGVAFVSYNTFPGGHLTLMLREMLQLHVGDLAEPEARIDQALALLQFLAGASDAPDDYHQWIRAEAQRARGHERNHLYHDELAPINEPVLFKDFAAHAARHGLQFLAEADAFESSDLNFSPAARGVLMQLEGSRIQREQYLDFLKCRRFRQTLLCGRAAQPCPRPLAARAVGLFASAVENAPWTAVDLRHGVAVAFTTSKGAKIETDFGPGKAALSALAECWPASISLPELAERSALRLQRAGTPMEGETTAEALAPFLLEIYQAGFVALHTRPAQCVQTLTERPTVAPLARWQAAKGGMVTSAFHTPVRIEDRLGLHLLQLLDGTRDRAALAEAVCEFLRSQDALAEAPGGDIDLRRSVERELNRSLEFLARLGLLAG